MFALFGASEDAPNRTLRHSMRSSRERMRDGAGARAGYFYRMKEPARAELPRNFANALRGIGAKHRRWRLVPGFGLRTLETIEQLQQDEAQLNMRTKKLVATAIWAGWLLQGSAQTGSAQTASVDPGLLAKATAGDAAAEVQVGAGYAAQHDLQQAAAWYKKAADQDNPEGEIHLAALYRDGGKGFPRDMEQAAAWYRKAADQGDATAQGTLGTLYTLGQGVPRSDAEAYYWLDLAASVKGPNQAQYAANRQVVGTRITADELADVEDRVAKWKAAHPRPDSAQ